MEFSVFGVNSVRGTTSNAGSKTGRPGQYVVKKGDTLSKIAQKYGMTIKQFCAWTGLRESSTLSIGQRINLKQDTVPSGKGLLALINKYGMDKEAFCELNGIKLKDFNSYKVSANEKFYVCKGLKKSHGSGSTSSTRNTVPSANSSKTSSTTSSFRVAKSGESVRTIGSNKKPPIPKDANGHITAEVIKFNPRQPNTGELKGKTIMVNAGHGWKESGGFDIGAPGTDVNGHEIDEWRKNRDFAQDLIEELTARGATVIFTAGEAMPVCKAKSKYRANAFISLHCNANPDRRKHGLDVYYMSGNATGQKFASIMGKKLGANVKADVESGRGKIGVLRRESQTPSVLLELGFLTNKTDQLNIDSRTDRKKRMKLVADGVVEMLK